MNKFKLLDCTLRDGGYYTNWDFHRDTVKAYLNSFNSLGVEYLEVGYRNPLSDGYYGEYFFCPPETLQFLKDESEKKLAIILNEKDVRVEMIDALLDPCEGIVTMVRMAIDPVNFNRALELAEAIKDKGFEVAFNVMYMFTWDNHPEFNYLIEKSLAVITDSGGITEETTVMGVPCLTLRENTERPETISVGTNELIGTNPKNIGPAMKTLFSGEWKTGGIPELWDGKSAKRIMDVLQNLRLSI
jgi:UDP-N-acetylglucosamine 2-epimerase